MNDPTNRDSVPAMLTPGEFVLNKEASTMFGPAIEAMNNAGLQQRQAENRNMGGGIPQYNTGGSLPTLPTAYNIGGLVKFLKDKEGWRDEAYQDDAGVWTIGYGRTTHDDGSKIKKGDTTKRADEDSWLNKRAQTEMDAINAFGKKHDYTWSHGQKNALASFRYNGGQGMIDMLTANGTRDNATIKNKFGLYNKVTDPKTGKKVPIAGLTNRRNFELELWNDDATATPAQAAPAAQQPVQQQAVPQMQEAPPVPQQAAPPPQQRDEDMYYPVQEDFGGAFAAARKAHGGDGGQFTWKDDYYTTDVARNVGGPIGYNKGGRAGKKVKYWDSAQGTYVWGTKEQAAQAAAQSSLPQVEPTVTERNPMNFRKNAGVQAPPPPMQPMPGNPMQLGNVLQSAGSDPVNTAPSRAGHIGNRFNFGAQPPSLPPQVDSTPPVPGSDEALLQGGSQKVEQEEEDDNISYLKGLPHQDLQQVAANPNEYSEIAASILGNRNNESTRMQGFEPMSGQGNYVPYEQPPPTPDPRQAAMQQGAGYGSDPNAAAFAESERMRGNALLGDYAKQFERGDPRRAAAFNQQAHQVGGTPGVPEMQLPPPPPQANAFQDPSETGGTGAVPMANAFQDPSETGGTGAYAGNQVIANLPIGDPTRMAAIESGDFIPTEGDLNHEDQQYQTNEALRREQLLASVTVPDAPAAQGRQNRINALTSQLDSLGMPTAQQGVGTNVQVGGVDAPPELAGIPNQPVLPNEVGAVPGLDTGAPLPQDVIDNNPQGLFGDMTEIMPYVPGGEADQGLQQASETDSPIVTKPGGALMNVDELGNQTPVVNTSPPIERKSAVQTKVAELGEPMADDEAAQAVTAGESADPSMIDKAKGLISDNFGGLFDEKELKRAAVLFAGAMITGMSPQRALAYAGTNYINRIDAKEARQISAQAATSKAGADAAAKASLQPTSNNKTFWKNGQKMEALEMKAKDGTSLWVDKTGTPINTFEWTEDGKGSKAWKTQLKGTTDNTNKQLKELKETFGQIDPNDKTAGYKTDILPQTSAGKIAEWADQNGVDPAQLSGLVESAYHNTLNGGTSGERTRSIIPALEQLVIKQKTGNDKVWNMPDGKPVNMRKLNILNTAASNKLRMLGYEGTVDNIANIFYGEALADWNALGPEGQKEFNDKAGKGENGFYFFANKMIMDFNPGG